MNKTDRLLRPENLDFLRACFDTTEIDKGRIYWKERPRNHFQSALAQINFNRRYPGTLVGKKPCLKMPHIILGVTHPDLGPVRIMLHRLIWLLKYEEVPPKLIDHINRIPFDNRPVNLRAATHSENMENRMQSKDCSSYGSYEKTEDGNYSVSFFSSEGGAAFNFRFPTELLAVTSLNFLSFLFDNRYHVSNHRANA
ncbi:HNH endonuclease signature motif containing protein [Citreimonas salinaria]|uniref:HNH endonuclease n=1 Tax=Citreimonas salinaria TaxID=321339 RepID=A0A1H3LMB3_9RHOB|nr:HNH endonuclease signature motif containing protein [Citreimonas salinaria]SDY65551.1 HNH endonuclease [Citreimonas salinaria]